MWKAGDSGNPNGRRAEDRKLKLLCRVHTEKACEKLAKFLDSDNPMVVIAAAKELLDRAYGKAKQMVEGRFEHEHIVSTSDESQLAARLGKRSTADTVANTVQ